MSGYGKLNSPEAGGGWAWKHMGKEIPLKSKADEMITREVFSNFGGPPKVVQKLMKPKLPLGHKIQKRPGHI